MRAKTKKRRIACDWQVEFVRLIAFPNRPAYFIEQEWWQELTSQKPADSNQAPQDKEQHVRLVSGMFQGTKFSLKVDLHRVHWEARPPVEADASGNFTTLGPFREKLPWFVELMTPWLRKSCPPLHRIAFSAHLLQPAATAEEAYRILAGHLPTINLDANPDDFVLQINRAPSSEVVPDLPINRVCTWSKMNAPIPAQPGKKFEWPVRCYAALELDINTAPENAEILPQKDLPRVFTELTSLGIGMAEHGDVP